MKKLFLLILLLFSFSQTWADNKIANLSSNIIYASKNTSLDNGYIIVNNSNNTKLNIYDLYGNLLAQTGSTIYINKLLDFYNNSHIYLNFYGDSNYNGYVGILDISDINNIRYNPGAQIPGWYWRGHKQIKFGYVNGNLLLCGIDSNDNCGSIKKIDLTNFTVVDYTGNLTTDDLQLMNIGINIPINDNTILSKENNVIYKIVCDEQNGICYKEIAFDGGVNATLKTYKWIYNGTNQYWSVIYETGGILYPTTYITEQDGTISNIENWYIKNYLANGEIWKLYDRSTMGIDYIFTYPSYIYPQINYINENLQDFKFTYLSGSELWYTNPDTTQLNIIGTTSGGNTGGTTGNEGIDYPSSTEQIDTALNWDTNNDGELSFGETLTGIWTTIKSWLSGLFDFFAKLKSFINTIQNIGTDEVRNFSFFPTTYASESDIVWGKLESKIGNTDNFTGKFFVFTKGFLIFLFFVITLLIIIKIKRKNG